MSIEFEIKIEIKIDENKYKAVKSTQGCEGCVALSDPELCGFLSITLANETYGGLRENNSGNINEIKRLKQDNICDIFGLVFVQPEQEVKKQQLIEKYNIFLRELIENDGEGLALLKAYDIETYNRLKGALAQPEPEPVAWVFPSYLKSFETQETTAVIYSVEIGSPTENSIPLYKESPNQKPLSDEWIKNNIHFAHQDVSFTDLVRAVEKAHGIGVE